jgi:hypothetical protein
MSNSKRIARMASRAAANLVAVAAISAIFGAKALLDDQTRAAEHARFAAAAEIAAADHEPYLTEQP